MRYLDHSGPDSDLELARAEFTALLALPEYPEGDLARMMLILLRTASLRDRSRANLSEEEQIREAFGLPAEVLREAVADISQQMSGMSDEAANPIADVFTAISPLFLGDAQDPASVEKAIARIEAAEASGLQATALALLRSLKANTSHEPDDKRKALAAAQEADRLLDDDKPLESVLRDMARSVTLEHDDGATLDIDDLPGLVGSLRRVLGRMPPEAPERGRALISFVAALSVRFGESARLDGFAALREFVEEECAHLTEPGVGALARGMVGALDGVLREDAPVLTAAIAALDEAHRTLDEDHPLHPLITPFMSMALSQRAVSGRSIEDFRAASRLMRSADLSGITLGGVSAIGELGVLLSELRHTTPDAARFDDVIELMEGLPEDFRRATRFNVDENVQAVELMRTLSQSFGKTVTAPAPADPGTGYWSTRQSEMTAAALAVHNGFNTGDLDMLDDGIAGMLEQKATNPRDDVRRLMFIGISYMFRYSRSMRSTDLDRSIEQMASALRLVHEADASDAAGVHYYYGDALHMRGNRRRDQVERVKAAVHGIAAMKARASEVLLQSRADHALTIAQHAKGEAASIVQWCLVAERLDLAVHALELGRSLVLHTVSAEASIAELLREAGEPDLAALWETEAEDEPGAVPSDLRFRVLAALEGTKIESQLLRPPSLDVIRAALRRTDSDALVYLLPESTPNAGFAIVVPRDGEVRHIGLPRLRSGPVEEFETARRALADPSAEDEKRWQDAITASGDWAWTAVMGRLLDEFAGLPRLVLVPVGELGAVPWHAARRQVGGQLRYACEDAVITYAASARQFVDAARRDRRPVDDAVALVRVRDETLRWAPVETTTVRDNSYPAATCVEDGVRPGEVLGQLPGDVRPGASVLHLTCHAAHATPAVDSHLLLDNGEVLPVRDVLRQARHRPVDADGGLVVLASCASDLTEAAHDEALTLATAFLAAGATGVVGARWPIVDVTTTLFVIMFHHYLTRGYDDPAVALRLTQRWMIDPNRRIPPYVPRDLASLARISHLDDAGNWAAFTYQGR